MSLVFCHALEIRVWILRGPFFLCPNWHHDARNQGRVVSSDFRQRNMILEALLVDSESSVLIPIGYAAIVIYRLIEDNDHDDRWKWKWKWEVSSV